MRVMESEKVIEALESLWGNLVALSVLLSYHGAKAELESLNIPLGDSSILKCMLARSRQRIDGVYTNEGEQDD